MTHSYLDRFHLTLKTHINSDAMHNELYDSIQVIQLFPCYLSQLIALVYK